ncbi:MAG: TadE/TadG family type IV pilus assembly protein [Aliidongia sp.]
MQIGDAGSIIARPIRGVARKVTKAFILQPLASIQLMLEDTRAVTSLEFAIIFIPFFMLIFGTFSLGLWYYYSLSLDLAIYRAGREVMTGALQGTAGATTMTTAQFTNNILCPALPSFMPCSNTNPVVNMAVVTDFNKLTSTQQYPIPNSGSPPLQYTQTTINPLSAGMCSPAQGSIVYIQAIYQMPSFALVYNTFSGQIMSGTTVQVEQFPTTSTVSTNCGT